MRFNLIVPCMKIADVSILLRAFIIAGRLKSYQNMARSPGRCCLKRKINESVMMKSLQSNDLMKSLQKFVSAQEKFRASGKTIDHELLKAIPESIINFFTLYVKQVNAIGELFDCLDQLLINSKSLFDNNKILNQFHKISDNSTNALKNLTNSVVEELSSHSKNVSVVSPSHVGPSYKLRRVETSTTFEDDPKSPTEDDDIDFVDSDIDLQLDEIVEKVCESRIISAKSSTRKLTAPHETSPFDSDKNSFKLNYDSDGYVKVFIDGACSSNGASNAQAGIGVWFGECNFLNVSERAKGIQTNNNAEIQAATRAILKANSIGVKKLRLFTDSQFVINCMTKWIFSWKQKNWINSYNKPVINKDSLVELDNVIPLLDAVDWKYVQGHKGIIGNERADSLAKAGAKKLWC